MTHKTPIISVVIPCYFSEKYLRETMESVGRQTFSEWEIIIVEDGSNDNSEKMVHDFSAKFCENRVRYIRHPTNRGPSAARNTGVHHSTGKFIAFLDADDCWPPQHLEIMAQTLQNNQADLVYCTLNLIDDKTGLSCGHWGPTETDLKNFPNSLFLRNMIGPSGVVCRREVFNEALFDESPEIQSCEDHDLWMTLIKLRKRFFWTSKTAVNYRKNHSGAATSNQERMCRADLAVMYRHLGNPCFGFKTKCKGLSQNYALLAEALLEKRKWKSLFFYLRSWFCNPLELRQLKRLVKAFGLLSFRLAD